MGAHRDQITALLLNPFYNLGYRLAVGELCFSGNPGLLKLRANLLEVIRVLGDLRTDCVRPIGARGPTVSNVKQDDTTLAYLRQIFDVADGSATRRWAIQSYENCFVHGRLSRLTRQ